MFYVDIVMDLYSAFLGTMEDEVRSSTFGVGPLSKSTISSRTEPPPPTTTPNFHVYFNHNNNTTTYSKEEREKKIFIMSEQSLCDLAAPICS